MKNLILLSLLLFSFLSAGQMPPTNCVMNVTNGYAWYFRTNLPKSSSDIVNAATNDGVAGWWVGVPENTNAPGPIAFYWAETPSNCAAYKGPFISSLEYKYHNPNDDVIYVMCHFPLSCTVQESPDLVTWTNLATEHGELTMCVTGQLNGPQSFFRTKFSVP